MPAIPLYPELLLDNPNLPGRIRIQIIFLHPANLPLDLLHQFLNHSPFDLSLPIQRSLIEHTDTLIDLIIVIFYLPDPEDGLVVEG